MDYRQHARQRGVAVVTALLLTTLAITIVASLFWQQQVQVRSIENQRQQLQKKWILRGAVDWARLILREDVKQSAQVDHLGEPWAVKLQDTRLDQYVENGNSDSDASDATLSGQITDAQALYNINNLASNGLVNDREVAVFGRLLSALQLPSELAARTASVIAQSQIGLSLPSAADSSASNPASSSSAAPSGGDHGNGSSGAERATVKYVRFTQLDDLLSVPGFNAEMLQTLRPYAIALPRSGALTPININTAPAQVIAARISGLSLSDAALIVASRDRTYFNSVTDFKTRFPDRAGSLSAGDIEVWTSYFLVNGRVRMNRTTLDVSVLVQRSVLGSTSVLWVREN